MQYAGSSDNSNILGEKVIIGYTQVKPLLNKICLTNRKDLCLYSL